MRNWTPSLVSLLLIEDTQQGLGGLALGLFPFYFFACPKIDWSDRCVAPVFLIAALLPSFPFQGLSQKDKRASQGLQDPLLLAVAKVLTSPWSLRQTSLFPAWRTEPEHNLFLQEKERMAPTRPWPALCFSQPFRFFLCLWRPFEVTTGGLPILSFHWTWIWSSYSQKDELEYMWLLWAIRSSKDSKFFCNIFTLLPRPCRVSVDGFQPKMKSEIQIHHQRFSLICRGFTLKR